MEQISQLVRQGRLRDAFELSELVFPVLPNDSTLKTLRPAFTDLLEGVTVPAGARVSVQWLGSRDTAWRRVGITPLDSLPMPKLLHEMGYRMRIEREGYENVDLFAAVFTDARTLGGAAPIDTLYLDPLGGATAGMARIRGFSMPNGNGGRIKLADYHIGKREVPTTSTWSSLPRADTRSGNTGPSR